MRPAPLFLAMIIVAAGMAEAGLPVSRAWWSLDYSKDLATLGVAPDARVLDPWQESISRQTFERMLDSVYTSGPEAWRAVVETSPGHAAIVLRAARPGERVLLRFAENDAERPARWWRSAGELPAPSDPARPLEGLRVALDPGHLGGAWAKFEDRYFQIGDDPPVREGNMVLLVARKIDARLSALGATVTLLRSRSGPVTELQPVDLTAYARAMLDGAGLKEIPESVLQRTRARAFCVNAEVRARAALVNDHVRPDMVLALHFNAEPWGAANKPVFAAKNHLHVLVHGCLEPAELAHDDERMEMLVKLLQRTHETERDVATALAARLAEATGLPPYEYTGKNARRVNDSPYVWARNLLASRLFQCPVIYLEPHVMNHKLTYQRIQAGDYPGKRVIGSVERPNIFDEYADAVTAGLLDWRAVAGGVNASP